MLQATYGAFGQPAGFYPGRAEPFGGNPNDFKSYLAKNQTGIDDIQNRIVQIRIGAKTPGCIGEDEYTCIATLAQRLTIADRFALPDYNIFPDAKYDVNGKPVTGSKITFDGYFPDAKAKNLNDDIHTATTIELTIGASGSVSKLHAHFPKNPTYARTQDEYDATAVYEVVSSVAAKACPALTRSEVATWVQNVIKPGSRSGPKERFETIGGTATATDLASKRTAFCGRTFQFHSVSGVSHEGFQHVAFDGMSVEVE